MKRSIPIFLIVIWSFALYGQEDKPKQKLDSSYDRSSLTVFFMNNQSEEYWSIAQEKFPELVLSDKYNNNNFESIVFPLELQRKILGDYQDELGIRLSGLNMGKQVVSLWYNRKPDGTMDMDRVHERGRFTATDADFLLAQTSKRGNAALEEFGNRLISLSYILVLDLNSIINVDQGEESKNKGWTAKVTSYLYKIDFNDEVKYAFYDTWIYDDDTEEVKNQKRAAFNQLQIPIVPVLKKSIAISATQPKADTGLGLFFKPKSTDVLLKELVQKAYDESLFNLEKSLEEFKVKTALFDTNPYRAKIGMKEGLKTDYRFFVYEYVYNEKTGQAEPKRRGVIRASSQSKIVDNRKEATGDMGTSQFYQVGGRKLEQGFILQQQNDYGVELSLGLEMGGIGGLYGRLDARLGRYVGIRSLFVFLEGGFDAGNYYNAWYYLNVSNDQFMFYRYALGVAKGYYFARNFELRPYVSVGLDNAMHEELEKDYALSAIYAKPGFNLALNLKHNFQIVAGAGYHLFVTNAENSYGEYGPWDEIFEGRSGISMLVGVKFDF